MPVFLSSSCVEALPAQEAFPSLPQVLKEPEREFWSSQHTHTNTHTKVLHDKHNNYPDLIMYYILVLKCYTPYL